MIADPESMEVNLSEEDSFLILATDGVWEFISSQTAVEMVSQFESPSAAAEHIAAESYRLWLMNERRTDDISLVIIYFTHKNK